MSSEKRPRALVPSTSFSRFSTSPESLEGSRMGTFQGSPIAEPAISDLLLAAGHDKSQDIFEQFELDHEGHIQSSTPIVAVNDAQNSVDELPVELLSLTDRFIESLSAKVYATPPSVEKISELFQDFYIRAASTISIHISSLSSRIGRESHSTPSRASRNGNGLRSQTSRDSLTSLTATGSDQQMLTPSEVAERRKKRRMLEFKRVALEETVERRACEKVYDKIWRHPSTLDDMQDEKLRSRTAALSVVGIDLTDLGVDIETYTQHSQDSSVILEVNERFADARNRLIDMNKEKYPLGKLRCLAAAHTAIVDALTSLHPSGSSADEILPTLIYCLITLPPPENNLISHLHFIQRFRAVDKLEGDAAYCLTNLEAAISFLETVNLSSLREDEMQPNKGKTDSRPQTPVLEGSVTRTSSVSLPQSSTPPSTSASEATSSPLRQTLSDTAQIPQQKQRRLSHLLQPSTKVLEAANGAVREKADRTLKDMNSALDNSFKFLFGKLKEQQNKNPTREGHEPVQPPKTLEDARKLVNPILGTDEEGAVSVSSSVLEESESNDAAAKVELESHQGSSRDRSVESCKSNGSNSGNLLPFSTKTVPSRRATGESAKASPLATPSSQGSHTPSALESMRNLGSSLNPLNRLATMGGVMGGFGRRFTETPPPPPPPPPPTVKNVKENEPGRVLGKEKVDKQEDRATEKSVKEVQKKIARPVQRFLDLDGPGELRLSDVPELLNDYVRLAKALKEFDLFE